MILTDYYKFVHLPDSKSKMSDVPQKFNGGIYRRANKAITKGKNISSIFVPDILLNIAYGDIMGTKDAILILFEEDYKTIEMFIARGQKNNRLNLWQMLFDGELNDEISKLKNVAVTETVTIQITKKGASLY